MPARKKRSPQENTPVPPEPILETQQTRPTTVKTIPTAPAPEKKRPRIKFPSLNIISVSALQKLRYLVALIFLLSTLAFALAFINFPIALIFILISYVLLLGLLFKLFTIKHL